MAPRYRYTTPVDRKEAQEPVASIYAQIQRDFLLADGPLMSLSPDAELLAATWALLRESQLASGTPRTVTELIAVAVSQANNCSFCIDAHTMLLHATGAHALAEAVWNRRRPDDPDKTAIVEWAHATAHPERGIAAPPVPEEQADAVIGTALVTHFINRISSSLLNEDLLPGRLQSVSFVRRLGGRAMARNVAQQRTPGDSLDLIGEEPDTLDTESLVRRAFAALRGTTDHGTALLGHEMSTTVRQVVNDTDPDAIGSYLAGMPLADQAGVRLATLAALDPHRIGDNDVARWRETHPDDVSLIRLVAWGAMLRVNRIAEHVLPVPAAVASL